MKLLDEYTPPALILIAFLGGVSFAIGAGAGGWMIWWLVAITD